MFANFYWEKKIQTKNPVYYFSFPELKIMRIRDMMVVPLQNNYRNEI